MHRVEVSSSNVAAIEHDPTTAVLEIKFRNGSRYRYFLVPRRLYDALRDAPSKGKFFNTFVRGKFAFTKL